MFDVANDFLLIQATVVLAFLFLGVATLIATFLKWKRRERWRPISEAPIDKTLLLLKVEYRQGDLTPLFLAYGRRGDRLYFGDTYVTIGYKKQKGDDLSWYAAGLTQTKDAVFVEQSVRPTHFRFLPLGDSDSSH